MRPLPSALLLSIALCLASLPRAATPVGASAFENQCWSDWSKAAPVVHREALRPAKDVRALAQTNAQGQLLNITLCAEQGQYVYRLLILRSAGTVEAVTVDARAPFGK